jgi:hypothetical protein
MIRCHAGRKCQGRQALLINNVPLNYAPTNHLDFRRTCKPAIRDAPWPNIWILERKRRLADEEAYMKLIDIANLAKTPVSPICSDRLTPTLTLAQAAVAQQNEGGPMHKTGFEQEEGPANEAAFSAQINADDATNGKRVDYYAVAHRISEKVTRQPNILVSGKLKDYKGLRWMVSLDSLQQPS